MGARLDAEPATRDRLDPRQEATRNAGVVAGLGRLDNPCDFDHAGRQVLLLETLPALGLEP